MGLEISARVRDADFFLRRAGFFFGAIFFGALFFLAINFFLGRAGFFADFFLRAGFFLAMREVYHPHWGGTTGARPAREVKRFNTETAEKIGEHSEGNLAPRLVGALLAAPQHAGMESALCECCVVKGATGSSRSTQLSLKARRGTRANAASAASASFKV